MHPCLSVPELVDTIASHCNNLSLTRLARTARLFDCALDRLWTEVPVQSLIECFSIEVVQRSPDRNYYCSEWTLLKHPERQHWERFHFYAKRVKSLEIFVECLDDALADFLCVSAPQGGLLPHLHACRFYIMHITDFRVLGPFICPMIAELRLTFDDSLEFLRHPVSTSFLASLTNLLPGLTGLRLDWIPSNRFPALAPFIQSFPNLTELGFQRLGPEHFPLIASLPRLTRLTLSNLDDGGQEPVTNMCRSLQYLNVASSMSSIQKLFRFISHCPLDEIHVLIDYHSGDKLDPIFSLIHEICEKDTLRNLEIDVPRFIHESRPVRGDSLLPLFDLPNIVEFRCPLYMIAVTDHHISLLAKSWSKLVYLDLICGAFAYPDTIPVTIKSLDSLATHCPFLTYFAIEFDADKVEFDVESPQTGGSCNRLIYEIDVGHSPLVTRHVAPMAAYLFSLFPNLRFLGSLKATWDMVEETVRLHRSYLAVQHSSRG